MLKKHRGFVGWGFGMSIMVLFSALSFLGCGSSDSSSADSSSAEATTNSAPLTKAVFVKQANAICKEGSDEIHAGESQFLKTHGIKSKASVTPKQSEEFLSEVVAPSIVTQAEEVAKLGAPEGDEKEVGTIVERLEEVAKAAEKAPATVFRETPNGPLAKVNEAAGAYGVEECKQP